jgi:hypothetical protein
MAHVVIEQDHLTIGITGLDRVLAFRSELRIPLAHIRGVEVRPPEALSWFHGLRMPGINLPGVVTAGTFYTGDGRVFYDMHDPHQTIALELDHESYRRVIVQVDDPEAVAAAIQSALWRQSG